MLLRPTGQRCSRSPKVEALFCVAPGRGRQMCRRPIAGLVTANRIPLGSLSGRRHRPASPLRVHLRRPNPRSPHSATQSGRQAHTRSSWNVKPLFGNSTWERNHGGFGKKYGLRRLSPSDERRSDTTGKCRQLCSMTRARLRSMILAFAERFYGRPEGLYRDQIVADGGQSARSGSRRSHRPSDRWCAITGRTGDHLSRVHGGGDQSAAQRVS